MAKVNKRKDRFFWRKLKSGYYRVDRKGNIRNQKGKLLGTVNSRGYVTIGCKDKNGKLLVFQAHRLVWMAFKGRIPDGLVPNHKDGNKQNNAIRNLELVTHEENSLHAVRTGLRVEKRGEARSNAEFTDKEVIKYRRMVAKGKISRREIARRRGCSHPTVMYMISGKTYSHLPLAA